MSCPSHPPSDFGEPFDTAAARLRAAVSDACARPRPWPARVAAAIYAALDFAVEDPAAARLLLVEPWAHGEAGTARRQRLLDRFATLLAAERPAPPDGGRLPAASDQLTVGAIAGIFGDRLLSAQGSEADLRALGPELVELTLLPYLGPAQARAWARRSRPSAPPARSSTLGDPALLRRIEFTEVLGRLQAMIGAEVQVVLNLLGHFFDCGFHARLKRVETLAGDDGPVLIVFGRAQGIALDPAELEAFVGSWPGDKPSSWVELHIAHRLRLVFEPLTGPESD